MNFPIYSIGHGNRNIESFFALLKKYQIDFLIDVRSDGKGKLQNQSEVINQLTGGMSVDIFGDVMEFKSRGKY